MIKPYCTQNDGKCQSCSLVNYNRDCQNNPLHGGHRPGAGRKPTGRKRQTLSVTDDEYIKIKKLIDAERKAID